MFNALFLITPSSAACSLLAFGRSDSLDDAGARTFFYPSVPLSFSLEDYLRVTNVVSFPAFRSRFLRHSRFDRISPPRQRLRCTLLRGRFPRFSDE